MSDHQIIHSLSELDHLDDFTTVLDYDSIAWQYNGQEDEWVSADLQRGEPALPGLVVWPGHHWYEEDETLKFDLNRVFDTLKQLGFKPQPAGHMANFSIYPWYRGTAQLEITRGLKLIWMTIKSHPYHSLEVRNPLPIIATLNQLFGGETNTGD